MTPEPLATGTWRWEHACATWTFELPVAPTAVALAACARGVLAALPGFAVAGEASWTTASAGDDAAVLSAIDDAAVELTLREHADLIAFALDLDLRVLAPDGVTECTLADGAAIHIEREDAGLVLWLALHVDLYARRTFGAVRDNDQLARLNAPRLAGFLARLVETTGARFHDVDAASYGEQATPHGFAI